MDDLLQSLGTPGKGMHYRTRPDAEANSLQGVAFEAAFDAVPITGDGSTLAGASSEFATDLAVYSGMEEQPELTTSSSKPLVSGETDVAVQIQPMNPEELAESILRSGVTEDTAIPNMAMTSQLAAVVSTIATEVIEPDAPVGPISLQYAMQTKNIVDEAINSRAVNAAPEGAELAKQAGPMMAPVLPVTAGTTPLPPNRPQSLSEIEVKEQNVSTDQGDSGKSPRATHSMMPSNTSDFRLEPTYIASGEGRTLPASAQADLRQIRMGGQKTPSMPSQAMRESTVTFPKTLSSDARAEVSANLAALPLSTDRPGPQSEPAPTNALRDVLPQDDGTKRVLGQGPGDEAQNLQPRRPLGTQISETELATDMRQTKVDLTSRTIAPQMPPAAQSNVLSPVSSQMTPSPEENERRPHLSRMGASTPERTGRWTTAPASSSGQAISAPMPSILQPTTSLLATSASADLGAEPLADLDFTVQTLSTPTTTGLSASASIFAQAPSATAQVIAQQIAAALSKGHPASDIPLELALDPPELGRLRMQISEIAGVMTLMIQAERPETADLMRRHLDLLAQEFTQEGMDPPSVHISGEGADENGQTSSNERSDASASLAVEESSDTEISQPIHAASGGLDLRL